METRAGQRKRLETEAAMLPSILQHLAQHAKINSFENRETRARLSQVSKYHRNALRQNVYPIVKQRRADTHLARRIIHRPVPYPYRYGYLPKNPYNTKNLLENAITKGRTNIVRELLDRGADVRARDSSIMEATLLHRAATEGHTDTARLLLDRGAVVRAKDSLAATPLHKAAEKGHTDTARMLLDRGADVHAKEFMAATPLHKAAEKGHTDTARMLLNKGADVHAKDQYGKTPLHRAVIRGHTDTARMLLNKDADVLHAKDQYGRTPFYYVRRREADPGRYPEYRTIINLLRSRGAT